MCPTFPYLLVYLLLSVFRHVHACPVPVHCTLFTRPTSQSAAPAPPLGPGRRNFSTRGPLPEASRTASRPSAPNAAIAAPFAVGQRVARRPDLKRGRRERLVAAVGRLGPGAAVANSSPLESRLAPRLDRASDVAS